MTRSFVDLEEALNVLIKEAVKEVIQEMNLLNKVAKISEFKINLMKGYNFILII